MRPRRDIVDIEGLRPRDDPSPPDGGGPKRFLLIWFRCCHAYGRIYRNHDETAFEGRCPRCGAQVHALIGPDGTARRAFEAR